MQIQRSLGFCTEEIKGGRTKVVRKAKMTPSLCYNSVNRACMCVGGWLGGGAMENDAI